MGTGESGLTFANMLCGPSFNKVHQAGKPMFLAPWFACFHLLLISLENCIFFSSVYLDHILPPSNLLPHPLPFLFCCNFCSLKSGFGAHAVTWGSLKCHVGQYFHCFWIKCCVFSVSPPWTWVEAGRAAEHSKAALTQSHLSHAGRNRSALGSGDTKHLQRKIFCFLLSEGLGFWGLGKEEQQFYK